MPWKSPKLHQEPSGRQRFYCNLGGRKRWLGRDKTTAQRRFSELLAEHRRPVIDGPPVVVAELFNRWVADEQPTAWTREQTLPFADWAGSRPLATIDTSAMRAYADDLRRSRPDGTRYSDRTVYLRVYLAMRLMRYAHAQGWIAVMPARPTVAKARPKMKDIAPDRVEKMIAALPTRAKRLCYFILATGCRPGEARLLEWTEVFIDEHVCILDKHKNSKRGKPRTIYLTPEAEDLLRTIPQAGRHVFASRTGRPYTKDGIGAICRKRGFNIYALRHTFAQHALEHSDAGRVRVLLGHASMEMVDWYCRVKDQDALKTAQRVHAPVPPVPGLPAHAVHREATSAVSGRRRASAG